MRKIKGHRAWSFEEVIGLFKRDKMFTMCDLPHYRYDRVRGHCKRLRKMGMIQRRGFSDTAVHWVITDLFKRWMIEQDLGITDLGVVKWAKQRDRQFKDKITATSS